jgi:hypothetical protein
LVIAGCGAHGPCGGGRRRPSQAPLPLKCRAKDISQSIARTGHFLPFGDQIEPIMLNRQG